MEVLAFQRLAQYAFLEVELPGQAARIPGEHLRRLDWLTVDFDLAQRRHMDISNQVVDFVGKHATAGQAEGRWQWSASSGEKGVPFVVRDDALDLGSYMRSNKNCVKRGIGPRSKVLRG